MLSPQGNKQGTKPEKDPSPQNTPEKDTRLEKKQVHPSRFKG
jgi:hypothetical protein